MKKTLLKSTAALIVAIVSLMLVSAFFTACGSSDCVKFIEKLYRADSFSVTAKLYYLSITSKLTI